MQESYKTLIQQLLGVSDQDIQKAIYRNRKRTYRQFLKIKHDAQIHTRAKKQKIFALDHYNCLFWWTTSQLQTYARSLSEDAYQRFKKNIVRIDAQKWVSLQPIYIDIREVLLILQEMWYSIEPNARFYNSLNRIEAKEMGLLDIYKKDSKSNYHYKNKQEECQETQSSEKTQDPEATKLREGTIVMTKSTRVQLKKRNTVHRLTKKQGRGKSTEKDGKVEKSFRTLIKEASS